MAEEKRPGLLVRLAAGAWHVPAGVIFLLRRPALWGLAVLPSILGTVGLASGLVLGVLLAPSVAGRLALGRGGLTDAFDLLLEFGVWVGTVGLGLVLGLGASCLVTAPLLERLSVKVELEEKGVVQTSGSFLAIFARASYMPAAAPLVLLISLIPVVGPLLGVIVSAHALAAQETAPALARTGRGFRAQREWHRHWWAEGLGFGLAGLVLLPIPLVDFLLPPVLVVGATRLVLELQSEPADREDLPAG